MFDENMSSVGQHKKEREKNPFGCKSIRNTLFSFDLIHYADYSHKIKLNYRSVKLTAFPHLNPVQLDLPHLCILTRTSCLEFSLYGN